jgi:carbon-monoxide dehydrogenase large subunit
MSTTETAPSAVIGQRLLRREDPALRTGEARYTNDLDVPGALHQALVRSPYNAIRGASTKSDTAGTEIGDHPGVTARTTTAGGEA